MKASTTICITLVAAVAMIYVMLQYIGVDIGECLANNNYCLDTILFWKHQTYDAIFSVR